MNLLNPEVMIDLVEINVFTFAIGESGCAVSIIITGLQ